MLNLKRARKKERCGGDFPPLAFSLSSRGYRSTHAQGSVENIKLNPQRTSGLAGERLLMTHDK